MRRGYEVKEGTIQVDLRSRVPAYIQIIEKVKQLVVKGDLAPDDQLPTVRQLATELRVNFNTVARAYRMLDEAGLISTQHGRGTYIVEAPSEAAENHLKEKALESLTRQYLHDTRLLGCSNEEINTAIRRALEVKE
jgi:GntR family transcriptional regulator